MSSLNFVPDDYVHNNESRRINILCAVLLLAVVIALSTVFGVIKVQQRACADEEAAVFTKMTQMQKSLVQFEQLQVQREHMMKSALTIADLLETVPRSVLLAQLTNALPNGASLTSVDILQKDGKLVSSGQSKSHYQAAKSQNAAKKSAEDSPEKNLLTEITITGLAPSDLQVAFYIERLDNSVLLDDVVLIESREHEIDNEIFRQYRLKARLNQDIKLTDDAVTEIRGQAKDSIRRF